RLPRAVAADAHSHELPSVVHRELCVRGEAEVLELGHRGLRLDVVTQGHDLDRPSAALRGPKAGHEQHGERQERPRHTGHVVTAAITERLRFESMRQPTAWLFSGWNCVACRLPSEKAALKVVPPYVVSAPGARAASPIRTAW